MERLGRPSLILGAHRSGTSFLALNLSAMGLYLGDRLDWNQESVFFARMSEWLLRLAGGSWDNPAALRHALHDQATVEQLTQHVEEYLESHVYRTFRLLRGASPVPAWGWKDPRLAFTLPVWERVFPNARSVVIRRHGVDVAASLVSRERGLMQSPVASSRGLRWRMAALSVPRFDLKSLRCRTLDGAFSLWLEYARVIAELQLARPDSMLTVDFEALVADPTPTLERIAEFLGLDPPGESRGVRQPSADRAHAYRTDPGLVRFSEEPWVREGLAQLGYSQ